MTGGKNEALAIKLAKNTCRDIVNMKYINGGSDEHKVSDCICYIMCTSHSTGYRDFWKTGKPRERKLVQYYILFVFGL